MMTCERIHTASSVPRRPDWMIERHIPYQRCHACRVAFRCDVKQTSEELHAGLGTLLTDRVVRGLWNLGVVPGRVGLTAQTLPQNSAGARNA
jgi:hypothetical protein